MAAGLGAGIGCGDVASRADPVANSGATGGNSEDALPAPDSAWDSNVDGEARLRVHLAMAPQELPKGLVPQRVQVCNAARCTASAVQAEAERDPALDETLLADLRVPAGEVTELRLEYTEPDTSARATAAVAPVLVQPLEPKSRVELYLSLSSERSGSLLLNVVAADRVAPDATTVRLYRPARGAVVALESGLVVDLAPDAAEEAFVLGLSEVDVDGVSPHVAITPTRDLRVPARVILPVEPRRLPLGLTLADYRAQINGVVQQGTAGGDALAEAGDAVILAVQELGDLRVVTERPYVETLQGEAIAMPTDADPNTYLATSNPCATALAGSLAGYEQKLSTSQAVRITACESSRPSVHIVMVNLSRAGLQPAQRYPWIQFARSKNASGDYMLRTISEHVGGWNAFAGINGFTWSGDKGIGSGVGDFLGTVYLQGSRVSSGSGAEAIIGFNSSSSSTGTRARLFDKASGTTPSLSPYNHYAVGSTTSIIKNGACSRKPGAGPNLWSAVGIGTDRLVMVSSTSGQTTTAYDLCPVFEALRATEGAIRLDGGPSTSLFFRGRHLNPLTGMNNLVYGSARHILYAIVAK